MESLLHDFPLVTLLEINKANVCVCGNNDEIIK